MIPVAAVEVFAAVNAYRLMPVAFGMQVSYTGTAMSEPPRKYPHDVQTVHPDYHPPPQEKQMPTDPSLESMTTPDGVRLILEKLEKLAPSDLIRTLQGQMVTDKGEILSKIAELRLETRTEIASLRAANDTTNIALNSLDKQVNTLDGRVKKIESRSMPPRYSSSPMPQRYDLAAAAAGGLPPVTEKLVERLNELESSLHEVLEERDAAKKESFLAQERQGAVQKYANDKEKEAREAKEKSDAAVAAAEHEAEKKAAQAKKALEDADAAAKKKIDRLVLIVKLLAASLPIAAGLVHLLH